MTSSDRSFPEISEWVRISCDLARSRCHCGRDLRGDEVLGYPHDAGWMTNDGRIWLFIHCPDCGYEMALWKMGVARDRDFRTPHCSEEERLCDLAWAAPDPAGVRVIRSRGRVL